jgi:hypothetical protein
MTLTHKCPICDGSTTILDVVDFNKTCEENRGIFFPLSGIPIYYNICDRCEFTFSPQMWRWDESEFLEKIYNDDYIQVDPDYLDVRPRANAQLLRNTFDSKKMHIKHLDYGGGNGLLSQTLRNEGWDSTSYDPFPKTDNSVNALGKFNFITAFEVFEHVPDVDELMTNIKNLMDESSLVLFSTLLSKDHLKKNQRINWWYCSPRNGHISIFSNKSLIILGEKYDLKFGSFNSLLHCFTNKLPTWASHLVK